MLALTRYRKCCCGKASTQVHPDPKVMEEGGVHGGGSEVETEAEAPAPAPEPDNNQGATNALMAVVTVAGIVSRFV